MDLGIGAVSLTFQVFSGCMKGYQLLTEARHMEAEHKYMRIQLKKEQHRLLDWGHVAGVGVRDDELVISSSDKGLLHDVLEQQQNLLLEFGRYETRYRKGPLERLKKPFIVVDEIFDFEVDDDEAAAAVEASSPRPLLRAADTDFETRFPEGEELLKKALTWAKGARSFPKRLRWAAFDKDKMETLLLRLSRLNDFLRELLTTQQLSHLNLRQEQTCYQIIQLNNKMDQLVEIVKAGSEWSNLTSNGRSDAHGSFPSAHGSGRMNLALRAKELLQDLPLIPLSRVESMEYVRGEAQERGLPNRSLTQLARFKALETAISGQQSLTDDRATALQLGPDASSITDVELPAVLFTMTSDEDDDGDQNRRAEALFGSKSVWIEWKTYEPRVFDGEPDHKVVKRIEALVVLLKENSRSCQFRAPRCLGYFRDIDVETGEDRCRFGVVFEKPSSVPPSTQPISLLDLLRATERGTMDMPSLTERAKLAKVVTKALEELHAVNWLHKGLRSENILFFECELDPEDLRPDCHNGEPLSLELDLSRPYLSGFDYARPAQNEDLTEKPPENAAYDLYRHPDVQGSRAEGDNAASFQKTFDIYALGIILLEIAYWQPIDRILRIDLPKARPSTTLRVRNRLLSERKLLGHVKSHAGVVLEQVVRACLIGAEALVDGFTGGKFDEKEPVQAVQLQAGFYKHVVEKLAEVKI